MVLTARRGRGAAQAREYLSLFPSAWLSAPGLPPPNHQAASRGTGLAFPIPSLTGPEIEACHFQKWPHFTSDTRPILRGHPLTRASRYEHPHTLLGRGGRGGACRDVKGRASAVPCTEAQLRTCHRASLVVSGICTPGTTVSNPSPTLRLKTGLLASAP